MSNLIPKEINKLNDKLEKLYNEKRKLADFKKIINQDLIGSFD